MKKVTFKKLEDAKLNEVFPIVSEDFYRLIAGHTIALDERQIKDLIEKQHIKVGEQEINSSLLESADDSPKTSSNNGWVKYRQVLKNSFADKYLFMDDMVDAITHGLELNQNVLLYGKGGHNKSEGTLAILDNYCSNKDFKPFVKAFGEGLTMDDLFGGVKLKKAMETGEMEYMVENSFMNHEIVVFEEFYDAPPQVLLALKDIMTSRKFRNGNQIFDIKCKCIIALTNRTKEEVCEDNSIAALNERFSITLKVEWPEKEYTKANFLRLAKLKFGEEYFNKFQHKINTLSQIAEATNSGHTSFVSPRTFINAVKVYCNGGKLDFISELDQKIVEDVLSGNIESVDLIENENIFNSIRLKCEEQNLSIAIDPALKIIGDDNMTAAAIAIKKSKVTAMIFILNSTVWHSSLKNKVDGLMTTLNQTLNTLNSL